MTDNRRIATRHAVSIAAKLSVDGVAHECTLLNLSLGGALIKAGAKYPMGKRVTITFPIPTIEDSIEVGSVVRWSDASGVGLQFDGLRAREVWALNEYFKQLQSA